MGTKCSFKQLLIITHEYIGFIALVTSVISAKTDINYPDLKLGKEFWKWFRVPYLVPATNH